MTGIQTNFTAADMLGGKKSSKPATPAAKKSAPFFAPAPVVVSEPVEEVVTEDVVLEDVVSEDEES